MAKKEDILHLHEKTFVENPFLEQLSKMPGFHWHIMKLDRFGQSEAETGRSSFIEVIMVKTLEESLLKLNPWLETDQITEAIREITVFTEDNLIKNNKTVLTLLLEGTSADNRKTGEKGITLKYIDLNEPGKNVYHAVSEMRFRIPGTDKPFFPDIVLFVNGLPLVVVECKSPREKDAMGKAITQLMRYSEQRGFQKEGNKALFYYNQFIVATCRTSAKFGTITTHSEKLFYRWTDPYPFKLDELDYNSQEKEDDSTEYNLLQEEKTGPNDQKRLVHGMCWPRNMMDILRSFVVFSVDNKGNIIKVVSRYQQFRSVKLSISRLLNGLNKKERGGIIWHTQGSGKSLTMVFLIREMYNYTKLQSWKVVLLTDRKQLDKQLRDEAQHIGYTVKNPPNINELKTGLRSSNSEIVSAMIHKFQERDLCESFPELNPSDKILILTDEAHRSQYSLLGANLDKALPNATRIAFTGTPIEKTKNTFGDYIDRYTMRQAIDDGVTLKIVYEGRVHQAGITDQKGADKLFDDVFSDCDINEKLQVLGYGTKQAYMESWPVIRGKAADMLAHYLNEIFPNGYKAQVVTCSKEAAHRYRIALEEELTSIKTHFTLTPAIPYLSEHLKALIDKKEVSDSVKKELKEESSVQPSSTMVNKLPMLNIAVVLSSGHNDPPYIKEYAAPGLQEKNIASFKLSFGKEKDGIVGDKGMVVVVEMLLTGFDAPVEQVMYLDRVIVAHNLLQAIARVNRVSGEEKNCGFIIDYVGVGKHLKVALDKYFLDEDAQEALVMIDEEELFRELRKCWENIWNVLKENNIEDLSDLDFFYDIFYNEDIRSKYIEAYKKFIKAINDVFPRKEALDYVKDMLRFTEINILAGQHLRDSKMSMTGIPEKLRVVADKYLESKGIDQKIEPISILDEKFFEHVNSHKRAKTKAAEVQHAIRHHIEISLEEDPELYASFSEMLLRILAENKDNWDEIYRLLEELREKIVKAKTEPTYGLHRKKEMPFFRILKKEIFTDKELSEDEITLLVSLTREVFDKVRLEIELTGFWRKDASQNKLKGELQKILLSPDFTGLPEIFSKYNAIISRIMELAKSNHDTILFAE